MEIFIIYICWSIANGWFAIRLNRGEIRWFFASLIISPLVVTILLLALGHHGLTNQEILLQNIQNRLKSMDEAQRKEIEEEIHNGR